MLGAGLSRIFVASHSPGFSAGNMRVGNRHFAGVKDSGRPSCARVVWEPGAMSCTLSVFAVHAVVWASRNAWHATYEDMLVLERRHSSEVLGLDSVHLLYPRVWRWVARSKKMRVPPAIEGPCATSPKIHIQVISTPTKLQDRRWSFLQRDHKRNVSMYAASTCFYWAVAN